MSNKFRQFFATMKSQVKVIISETVETDDKSATPMNDRFF